MKHELTKVSETLLKGKVTELKAITYFLEKGYVVSVPEVPCQYDLLIDIGKRMLKVQVKTGRISDDNEYLTFNTSSITHNSNGYVRRLYTSDMVDFFCTIFEDQCYLIPFTECGSRTKKIRLVPTKNGQIKNISFARDYVAEDVLSRLVSE